MPPHALCATGRLRPSRMRPFRCVPFPFFIGHTLLAAPWAPDSTIALKRLILVNLDHYFPVRADIAAIHARRIEGHGEVAVTVYGDHAARPAQLL